MSFLHFFVLPVHYMGIIHFICSTVSGHLISFQLLISVITALVNMCGVSVFSALGYIPHSGISGTIADLFNILRK